MNSTLIKGPTLSEFDMQLGLDLKKIKSSSQSTRNRKSVTTRRKDDKDNKKMSNVVTIDCLDYSAALDLIAFGGIHGQVGVLDSNTLSFKGIYEAHQNEVFSLSFYDVQNIMLTMSIEGEVALWDAQKMQIMQVVRNKQNIQANFVNSMYFCKQTGSLLLGTSKVFKWVLKEDKATRITIEQQHTVAKDYLAQYRKLL